MCRHENVVAPSVPFSCQNPSGSVCLAQVPFWECSSVSLQQTTSRGHICLIKLGASRAAEKKRVRGRRGVVLWLYHCLLSEQSQASSSCSPSAASCSNIPLVSYQAVELTAVIFMMCGMCASSFYADKRQLCEIGCLTWHMLNRDGEGILLAQSHGVDWNTRFTHAVNIKIFAEEMELLCFSRSCFGWLTQRCNFQTVSNVINAAGGSVRLCLCCRVWLCLFSLMVNQAKVIKCVQHGSLSCLLTAAVAGVGFSFSWSWKSCLSSSIRHHMIL